MGEWVRKVRVIVRQSTGFLREAWQELKRVHWPTRKETYAATSVVLILVLLIALFLALVDFGLTRAIQVLLS
ncbi:MAG: preprotein translocase subunit SecE [Candidatus Binatia bacterium]